MKFIPQATCYMLLSAGVASAFAPATPATHSVPSPTTSTAKDFVGVSQQQQAQPSYSNSHNRGQLFLSDNTADDFKEKLDNFLVVDVQGARNQLAENWRGITTSGVLTMALGALAFYLPLQATGIAYDGTVITLGATGGIGLANAFVRENGNKAKSALSGLLYLGICFYMAANPSQGLDIITLSIATTIAAEGLYEITLAARNKELQARPWHFVSGVGSTLAGAWLASGIPVASLFAPGAALGARLTGNGATKIAVGLTGKEINKSQKN